MNFYPLCDNEISFLFIKHNVSINVPIFQQLLRNETWECVHANDDSNGIFTFWNIFLIFLQLVSLSNTQILISQKMDGLQQV
jgi:hypothetical protein